MFGQTIVTPPLSPSPSPSGAPLSTLSEERHSILQVSKWRETRSNGFNLYKSYWTLEQRPHDPDLFLSASDLENTDSEDDGDSTHQAPAKVAKKDNPYHPFPNWSSYKLGEWFWSEGEGKTYRNFEALVDIIGDEDFHAGDIRQTNWKKIDASLASSEHDDDLAREDSRWAQDGTSWKTTAVTIEVPFNSASGNPGSKPYILEGFRFRPLVPIILAKLQDRAASEHFHIVPSELWWNRDCPSAQKTRVYGELFHSDAFLEAYRQVQVSTHCSAQPFQQLTLLFNAQASSSRSRRGPPSTICGCPHVRL